MLRAFRSVPKGRYEECNSPELVRRAVFLEEEGVALEFDAEEGLGERFLEKFLSVAPPHLQQEWRVVLIRHRLVNAFLKHHGKFAAVAEHGGREEVIQRNGHLDHLDVLVRRSPRLSPALIFDHLDPHSSRENILVFYLLRSYTCDLICLSQCLDAHC